ncbi:hypothetical protein ACEPAI_2902 [Sanghuangporus weigelae]
MPQALSKFISVDYPASSISHRCDGILDSNGNELRGRDAAHGPSVGLNEAEARYNRRSRSASLGSSLDIVVSESRASDALKKLEKFVEYDRKWRQIRDGTQVHRLTFADFPWPTFNAVEPGSFLESVDKKTILLFLLDPLRIHVRAVSKDALLRHEKMNWVKGTLIPWVVERDEDILREAYAIIMLYVRGAEDDDAEINAHKAVFKRRLSIYPPPVRPLADFSISKIFPRETVPATEYVPQSSPNFAPTPSGSPTEPDFLLEQMTSQDSLFSQTDTIIFDSSPNLSPQPDVKEESFETSNQTEGNSQAVAMRRPSPVPVDEDADDDGDIILPMYN